MVIASYVIFSAVAAYLSPTSLTANEGQNVTIRICRQPSSSPVAALGWYQMSHLCPFLFIFTPD